ncbi:MAG: hypothetical protein SGJ10_00315 [Bacteroidota bacterium]|nr:hypothetical protein [Bacteroidota bacterium]
MMFANDACVATIRACMLLSMRSLSTLGVLAVFDTSLVLKIHFKRTSYIEM